MTFFYKVIDNGDFAIVNFTLSALIAVMLASVMLSNILFGWIVTALRLTALST